MKGDGARRQSRQEPGRPIRVASANSLRESITSDWPEWESDAPIVAMKWGNAHRAKGRCWSRACIRRRECRLGLARLRNKRSFLRCKLADGPSSDRIHTGAGCECLKRETPRKPDAGNPHIRFDEGEGGYVPLPTLLCSVAKMAQTMITSHLWLLYEFFRL